MQPSENPAGNLTYDDILLEVNSSFPRSSAREKLKKIAETMAENHISNQEKMLLQLYASDELSQEDLDKVLSQIDIEAMDGETVLLLAYMTRKFPALYFGNLNGPRLQGLLRYYRFINLEQFFHFRKIVGKLNENEIVPLIIKGGAMKYLRPELPRLMGDIDIVVSTQAQWETCKELVENMNYTYYDAGHSIDVHLTGQPEKGLVDIHKKFYLIDNTDYITSLFATASLETIQGVKCYVPSYEDLIFLIITNLSKNLKRNASLAGLPFSVIDLIYLSGQTGLNWDEVVKKVEKYDQGIAFYVGITFINNIVPGLIPAIFSLENISEKTVRKRFNKDIRAIKWPDSTARKYYWRCMKILDRSPEFFKKSGLYRMIKAFCLTVKKILLE